MADLAELIMTREHARIKKKRDIWSLIRQSYAGGENYSKSHLWQYPRESTAHFIARQKRAAYCNHVQPLVDMVSGFLFAQEVTRKIPTDLELFASAVSRGRPIDTFMRALAIHSLQYTCAVLMDAPNLDTAGLSKADVKDLGIEPYAVMYAGHQIRDYAQDGAGALVWVILDNSYCEDQDPTVPPKEIKEFRLWTRDYWQDFREVSESGPQGKKFVADEPVPHTFGAVPITFVNWRDLDDDLISDTPMEDIALFDRRYFNADSYLDEMLAAGTFKMLFSPARDPEEDIPKDILQKGVGSTAIYPFPLDASSPPFYAGHGLQDVEAFLAALKHYESKMLEKLGLDPDHDKKFMQTGVAKSLEFEKCESILRAGAVEMERVERWMFEAAAKWKNSKAVVEIQYGRNFQGDDIEMQINRLYRSLLLPSREMRMQSMEEIARRTFAFKSAAQIDEIVERIKKDVDAADVGASSEGITKLKEMEKTNGRN